MDTGEYGTNVLVINNISSIAFAIYEPSNPPSGPTSSLRSDTLQLEASLRNDGCLSYLDTSRRRLWCFRIARKDDSQSDVAGFHEKIEASGLTLSLTEKSSFEPAGLAKARTLGPHPANTPTASLGSPSVGDNTGRHGPPNAQPAAVSGVDGQAVVPVDPRGLSFTHVKEAYEYFISAAHSAVCSSFCARTGALPLNLRTYRLHKVNETTSLLATARIYLTSTGALLIMLGLSTVDGLIAVSDNQLPPFPSLGLTVLAAPLGLFATCQGAPGAEQSVAGESAIHSPDPQALKPRSEKSDNYWKNACLKLLQARGIPVSVNTPSKWLNLQRLRRKPIEPKAQGMRTPMSGTFSQVSWPPNLCFCKAFSRLSMGGDEPSFASLERSYDPLSAAQEWFLDSGERGEALARRKKEREAVAANEVFQSVVQTQQTNGLSPLDIRGPNTAATAPGAVYPTPPDGIPPITGATPSIDGTISSPGNNPHATATVDIDMAAPTSSSLPNETAQEALHDENWDSMDTKRERANSTLETDNLFGDLGGDVFVDNDITEADFNFFDEQPGDDMDLDALHVPDLPSGADINLDLAVELDRPQDNLVKLEQPDPQTEPEAPPSPVFAKPELRHARSSLAEEARRQAEPEKDVRPSSGHKRQASPLTPDAVFKRIRAALDSQRSSRTDSQHYPAHHGSDFDKVDFGPGLSLVNRKYEGSGRFDYSQDRGKARGQHSTQGPPTTDYLQRHGKSRRYLKDHSSNIGEILSSRDTHQQISSLEHTSPADFEEPLSDADELSLISDEGDGGYESEEPASPVKSTTGARRRRIDDDGESLAASFRDLECIDAASPHMPVELPRVSKSETELPLSRYFADPEPESVPFALGDEDFIMTAQILTEQCATSTLSAAIETQNGQVSKIEHRRELVSATRDCVEDLRSALPSCFGLPVEYQFRSFVELPDMPAPGQLARMQPRPPGADHIRPNHLFQIPTPHLELRRYESRLSILPSAVGFWESLGLGPTCGAKQVNAIGIFPNFNGMEGDMLVFMERMRSSYESQKLGTFSRLETTEISDGLVSYEMEKRVEPFRQSASILGTSINDGIGRICTALASLAVTDTNFVVFFVFPSEVAGAAVESCIIFRQLFEMYKNTLSSKKQSVVNELVLQLVPLEFIASSSSLASPTPNDLAKLALETYDRCTLFGGGVPQPAIVLEQPPPRVLDFKLAMTPSTSLLHENSCLHIAYAQSVDERWITAAWTDNRGSQQMTASYCLGRKGKAIATPVTDVALEIWETTKDFISARKVHWRIIIVKCGAMEPQEVDMWSSLAQAEPKSMASLTLLSVDTTPPLQLVPPLAKLQNTATSMFYTTPVSTPQPSIVSPEQSGNPPTPMRDSTATGGAQTPSGGDAAAAGDNEADATLTDVTDQAWGAVLAHRLSSSISSHNPALASGYLIKRGGARVEDVPSVMEVNIVHHDGNPRAYEPLLREMLTYYRGLGTLARTRGIVDRETDVRPWHVAVAEKGARALYMLM